MYSEGLQRALHAKQVAWSLDCERARELVRSRKMRGAFGTGMPPNTSGASRVRRAAKPMSDSDAAEWAEKVSKLQRQTAKKKQ